MANFKRWLAYLKDERSAQRAIETIGLTLGLVAATATSAHAQEITTYTYDAKGQVVAVARSGGPTNGTTSSYAYDVAGNRRNVTVSNSPNGTAASDSGSGAAEPQSARYVIVPLNGYTIIKTN